MNPPRYVKILAKLIPISKWENEENLAKGEIVKFNFVESCKNKYGFNKQVLSSEDGYDLIWRHISDDWFKLIAKSPEARC